MFAGRVALRGMTLAVLAIAAAVCTLLLRDAITPAEAKSRIAKQVSSTVTPVGASVRLEALGTQRDGITGRPRATWSSLVPVGEGTVRFLRTDNGDDVSVCDAKFADGPIADAVFLWKLEPRLIGINGGRSTLQVHWTRSRAGNPVAERDDTRTITLSSGDTHVLDYVENPDATASCASLMVRIAADPILPQSLQPVMVDLWTVDENAPGGARSVHQQIQGPGGDSITYQLPPLDIAPAGAGATPGPTVKMNVGGTLQATLAPDGFVDITLRTVRQTVSGNATSQGEGRVQFRTKVGETAAVLLPEPAGRLPLPGGEGSVDIGRLFAGHRLSLYVKVEAAR